MKGYIKFINLNILLSIIFFIFFIRLSFSYNNPLINNKNINNIIYIAKYYYNNKNFYKSLKLYNYIIYNKKIIYKKAMSNFYNKNYILAAFYFKKYYDNHNNNKKSKKIEASLYNYIYCLYLSSLDYNLDQENTYNAIYGIHEFIKKYPNNYKIPYINSLLNILIKKIEKKEFEIAKINYNIENYKSAFLIFKNFIIEYPNSSLVETALFYAINAKFNYAINSNNEKIKKKRLQQTIIFCYQFKKKYPNSKYNLEKIIFNIIKYI